MSHPLFTARGPRPEDANEMLDIDIKCFEHPWSAEEWARLGKATEYAMSVVTYFGSPIGVGVFRQDPDSTAVEILKLAVLKPHRRKHASLYLLAAAVTYAQASKASSLFIIVPESTIYPGPESIGPWLKNTGFSATKPFLKRHFNAYGTVEDGVKFTAPIRSKAA